MPDSLPFEMAKASSRLGGGTGEALEGGLGIEQVHLAGAAVHEEMDDGLGFAGEVRGLGLQIEGGRCGAGGEEVAIEDGGEGGAVKAIDESREEVAAGLFGHGRSQSMKLNSAEFKMA